MQVQLHVPLDVIFVVVSWFVIRMRSDFPVVEWLQLVSVIRIPEVKWNY